MTTETDLWAVVNDRPGDNTPLLALADWYAENGRPDTERAVREAATYPRLIRGYLLAMIRGTAVFEKFRQTSVAAAFEFWNRVALLGDGHNRPLGVIGAAGVRSPRDVRPPVRRRSGKLSISRLRAGRWWRNSRRGCHDLVLAGRAVFPGRVPTLGDPDGVVLRPLDPRRDVAGGGGGPQAVPDDAGGAPVAGQLAGRVVLRPAGRVARVEGDPVTDPNDLFAGMSPVIDVRVNGTETAVAVSASGLKPIVRDKEFPNGRPTAEQCDTAVFNAVLSGLKKQYGPGQLFWLSDVFPGLDGADAGRPTVAFVYVRSDRVVDFRLEYRVKLLHRGAWRTVPVDVQMSVGVESPEANSEALALRGRRELERVLYARHGPGTLGKVKGGYVFTKK